MIKQMKKPSDTILIIPLVVSHPFWQEEPHGSKDKYTERATSFVMKSNQWVSNSGVFKAKSAAPTFKATAYTVFHSLKVIGLG